MGRCGDVKEEGLFVAAVLIDVVGGAVVERVGVVEIVGEGFDRGGVVDQTEGVEEVDHAPDGSPMFVETAIDRVSRGVGKIAEVF